MPEETGAGPGTGGEDPGVGPAASDKAADNSKSTPNLTVFGLLRKEIEADPGSPSTHTPDTWDPKYPSIYTRTYMYIIYIYI